MRLGLGLTLTEAPSFFHLFLRRSTEKKKETKSNEKENKKIKRKETDQIFSKINRSILVTPLLPFTTTTKNTNLLELGYTNSFFFLHFFHTLYLFKLEHCIFE